MSDVCRLCKRPIILEGKYWTHENGVTYRHTPRLMPKADAPPTDADRIAAAVAALSTPDVSDAVKWTREGEVPTAHEIDMGIAITKALAILEGRGQG